MACTSCLPPQLLRRQTVKKLTITQAEKLIAATGSKSYAKASDWHGRCMEIATKLAPHFGGVAVYGDWLGECMGFWKKRAAPVHHGWIVLPGPQGNYTEATETIVDPTRWSFEDAKPYIWSGKNDGNYDEGGNQQRFTNMRKPDGEGDDVRLVFKSEFIYDRIKDLLDDSCLTFDRCNCGLPKSFVYYIANLPPDELGWFIVAEVYEALDRAGCRAFIPMDNWKMIDRRFGLKGTR